MTSGLRCSTDTVVRRVWAERLGVSPHAFGATDPVFVDRGDLTAAVVVRLGETVVVAAPEPALSSLRGLAAPQLLDVSALLGALASLRPSLFGVASLSYVDHRTISPVTARTAVRAATEADVEAVVSRCSADERDESGLLHMTMRWAASSRPGEAEAAAGYEVWGGGLAHLGVAVAAGSRGQGLGARAATAAAVHAMGAGLVPQWRCRLDNVASERVAERLGFVRVGQQVAIDLAPADHELTHASR